MASCPCDAPRIDPGGLSRGARPHWLQSLRQMPFHPRPAAPGGGWPPRIAATGRARRGTTRPAAFGGGAHRLYPAGYHCQPEQPLPFINLASQKQCIALHHMARYDSELLAWLRRAWPEHTAAKLDLGRCRSRMRQVDQIPYHLIGELAAKLTPADWIERYEASRRSAADRRKAPREQRAPAKGRRATQASSQEPPLRAKKWKRRAATP